MENYKIILKASDETKEFFLSEKYYFEEKEEFYVYHFKEYECIFEILDNRTIDKIILNIAGMAYEVSSDMLKDGKYIFKFPKKYYFQCIWGYTLLTIKIYTTTGESYYLYSKLINVILDYQIEESKNIENSVKEMVKYILENNVDLFFNTPEQKISINNTNFIGKKVKTLYNELNQLEQIVECYLKNKEYFLNDLKYKLLLNYKIENFEKVKNLDSNILKFIIQNPQYLQEINSRKGILYKKKYYSPTRTLVDSKEFDYNIEENRIILGFLQKIYVYIDQRLLLAKKYIEDNNKERKFTLQNTVNFYYEFYYKQLIRMKPIIESLYFYYKKIMKCDPLILETVPIFSNIFQNYQHYKEMYLVIYNWFENKNYNLDNKRNTLNNLTTVDKIYEYYSLGKLIEGILSLGYINEKVYNYKYSKETFSKNKEINTFIFYKDLKKITVYYQAYIYTDKFENELELYRVEGSSNSVYNPDFIIKLESPTKKNRYLILDSKWQKMKVLKNYTLKEIIYKYCYSIESTEKADYLNTIILQGREDIYSNYLFQNSKISLTNKNNKNPKLEIVPLNPKINKLNYILKIIESY